MSIFQVNGSVELQQEVLDHDCWILLFSVFQNPVVFRDQQITMSFKN